MLAAVDEHIPRTAVYLSAERNAAPALKPRNRISGGVVVDTAYINSGSIVIALADSLKHGLQDIDELTAVALRSNILS